MNKIRLMYRAPRSFQFRKTALALGWTAAAVVWFAGAAAVRRFPGRPVSEAPAEGDRAVDSRDKRATRLFIPFEAWSVFRRPAEPGADADPAAVWHQPFRLAGTFRVYRENGMTRKALVEDAGRGHAVIVETGDTLSGGVRVKEIAEETVTLEYREQTQVLTLNFSESPGGPDASGEPDRDAAWRHLDLGDQEILGRNRFGVQVDEQRWVFDRRKVLEYYNEVLEDADRLVSLFDSMKPLYGDDRRVNGYILIPEGEKTFFEEVGMREGDVIRKVNSMPLMGRRVAEGFIRDFASRAMNVAVFEIERAGETQHLVYELR